MEDRVPQILAQIIDEYGQEICYDSRRMGGLLRDFCGEYKLEINVLILAAQAKIPEELDKVRTAKVDDILFKRLVRKLEDSFGLTKEVSVWAVESFILGMGKHLEGQNPQPKRRSGRLNSLAKGAHVIKGQRMEIVNGIESPSLLVEVGLKISGDLRSEDVDVSAFLLNDAGKVKGEDFIFYNNLHTDNHALVLEPEHYMDAQGCTVFCLKLELSQLPNYIEKLTFALSIYENARKTFRDISKVFIRILDMDNKREVLQFNPEQLKTETALVLGEVYRYKHAWKFCAVGSGYEGGLASLCKTYGLEIED